MARYVFDIETNGLLDALNTIHSLVLKDVDSGLVYSCCDISDYWSQHEESAGSFSVIDGLKLLREADEIIGHNIIKFDIPAIQKVHPWFQPKGKITDTLVCTRLIWPNIGDSDFGRIRKQRLPGNLRGSQGLEAWGCRLGEWKGDYAKIKAKEIREEFKAKKEKPPKATVISAMVWQSWSKDMQDYCEQDVEVTAKLFERIEGKNYSPEALLLEHSSATLCAKIERNGFPFNTAEAADLYTKLLARRSDIAEQLKTVFSFWYMDDGLVDPKRTIRYKDPEKLDRIKGQPWTKIKKVYFNPASRDHISYCLIKKYGWRPIDFTPEGKPKVDEEVLAGLPYPEAELLTDYFLLQKRIGQIAEGSQAWLKVERDGCIFGSINPNGAVTGRATHSYPNIGQVPANDKQYGVECRNLFGPHAEFLKALGPDWAKGVQVGTDKSGLELRCLAHFMARWDDGNYGDILLGGDIHWQNVIALGLVEPGTERDEETHPIHKIYRAAAKTFIYGFLYGAGVLKIGRIILDAALKEEMSGLGSSIRKRFFKGKRAVSEGMMSSVGKKLKANFLAKLPALNKLIEAVKKKARKEGILNGLDGRKLHVRQDYAALNTLLQSAGAITCKKWMVLLEEKLLARGFKHGWDGDFAFVAWVHDELQIICKTKEIADEVGKLSAECAAEAGDYFRFRCPLTSDYAIGQNWAETH